MSRVVLLRSFAVVACLMLAAGLPLLGAGADDDAPAGRKYALLVGVKDYDRDQLRSLRFTENDVNDLAAVLQDAGYKRVVLMTESGSVAGGDTSLLPTAKNIRKQLAAMLDGRRPEDAVVVAFSGHGVQFREQKESYFCPMDADLEDAKSLVSLAEVYKGLEECGAGTKVLLVDACRNDPQAEASKGVEKVKLESVTRPQAERPPGGVAALFSCSEGQRSYESEKLGHGVFFHYVIEGLKGEAANKKGEVTLQRLVAYVTDEVPDAAKDVSTSARQQPQQVGDLSGAVPLVRTEAFRPGEVVENSIGMKLALIPAGAFLMGSPADEEGRRDNEARHRVEITKAFYMGCCLVTRGQFRRFVKATGHTTTAETDGVGGMTFDFRTLDYRFDKRTYWDNPSFVQTNDHPVTYVTWDDAVAFCRWLSKAEGKACRLPTEAEWEYACRAGTTTRFWCGDDAAGLKDAANVADAALHKEGPGVEWCEAWDDGYAYTSPVGHYRANPWGLYDMHGNVWQLCQDWYDKDYYAKSPSRDPTGPADGTTRVIRGGSWVNAADHARSAYRTGESAKMNGDNNGFRVVRVR